MHSGVSSGSSSETVVGVPWLVLSMGVLVNRSFLQADRPCLLMDKSCLLGKRSVLQLDKACLLANRSCLLGHRSCLLADTSCLLTRGIVETGIIIALAATELNSCMWCKKGAGVGADVASIDAEMEASPQGVTS